MSFQFNQGDRPLAGYTIDRGVGRGGFGEVYYATSDGGKEVALKYLRENPQIELRGVTHCLNLKSPYLVSLHDIRQNGDGDHFVIMEYVSGPSLREVMSAEPKGLGPQKAAYFLRELAKGLAYLHDRGIVHRDLKPGNIFYEDGYVKIGDYGLAKMMTASQHSGQTVSVGTVHYMAPEVGSGVYDRTIDIYALGVILYEMLLGRVPFSGATMGEVLMKHLTAQPEVDDLPDPFAKVIRKALAKDPKDRYQTVNEMAGELLGVHGISKSVVGFDPASLNAVARQAAVTVAAPPRPGLGPAPGVPAVAVAVDSPPPVVNVGGLSPEAASGNLRYAGFWIRVLAALIDSCVVAVASAFILILFGASMQNNPLYIGVSVIYEGLLIGRWNGQTLGKKTLGIKVISKDGRPCGEWQAFARALADLLSIFTLGIGYLMAAFSDEKRALHDRIAGTLHVYALR